MAVLASRLRVIADGSEAAVAEVLAETAEFILIMIRVMVPVDTGALKASYEIRHETPLLILIGSALLYSIFQEFGYHHYQSGKWISPQPHLVPAMAMGEQFFRNAMIRKMEELCR